MAFLVSFHTIKLGWMSLFFLLLQIIGSLLGIFFTSMEQNYAPLSWVRIFPFCCKLHWMSLLLWQIGGVSSANSTLGWFLSTFLVRAFSWVKGHIHTFFMPFTYVPLQGISWFKIHCVDLWMCMVACELKRGNPVGLILAETQCFRCLSQEGSKLLYGKSSSSSSVIPNFFPSSQPSGISLILHGFLLIFNPSRRLISSFIIIFIFSHSCSLSSSTLFFFFFFKDMAIRKALVASASYHTPQHILVNTIFCSPSIWVPDLEKPKNIILSPWGHENIYNDMS